jgi:hypothetical protein
VESPVFQGGIVMLSNRALYDMPELRAIRTRISHLHLEVTDAEIAAQMRRLASNGYTHDGKTMSRDECETVCEFVILESQNKLCHLDDHDLNEDIKSCPHLVRHGFRGLDEPSGLSSVDLTRSLASDRLGSDWWLRDFAGCSGNATYKDTDINDSTTERAV